MNKFIKKVIVCLCILILGLNIFLHKYTQPININREFKDAVVVKNGKIERTVDIKVNATLKKSDFLFRILSFREDLKGTIRVGNDKYYLDASNLKEYTNNCMWGEVRKQPQDNEYKFVIFMFDNLNSIYLSEDTENYRIAAPAKTMKEYTTIENKRLKK